jgi:hypothetical protein
MSRRRQIEDDDPRPRRDDRVEAGSQLVAGRDVDFAAGRDDPGMGVPRLGRGDVPL